MLSEKGKQLIIFEGYKFRNSGITTNGIRWKCTVKSCNAKIYVDEDKTVILKNCAVHNHERCKNLVRQIISNAAKRRATESMYREKPLKVIRDEEENNGILVSKTDVDCVRRNIYHARRNNIPSNVSNMHKQRSDVTSQFKEKNNIISLPSQEQKDEIPYSFYQEQRSKFPTYSLHEKKNEVISQSIHQVCIYLVIIGRCSLIKKYLI